MKEGPVQNRALDLAAAGEFASRLLNFPAPARTFIKCKKSDSAFGFAVKKDLEIRMSVLLAEDGKCLTCCTCWSDMKL